MGWKKINGYDKIFWLKLEKEMQESQLLLAASFQRHINCIFTHTAQTDAKMNLQELQVYNLEQKICVILRPNMIPINYERSQRLSYPKHAKTLFGMSASCYLTGNFYTAGKLAIERLQM